MIQSVFIQRYSKNFIKEFFQRQNKKNVCILVFWYLLLIFLEKFIRFFHNFRLKQIENRNFKSKTTISTNDNNNDSLSKVIAFSTAESYDFLRLKTILPKSAIYLPKNKAFYLSEWLSDIHFRNVFIFLSGSFVIWGSSMEKSKNFLERIIRNKSLRIEVNPYKEYKTETFFYEINRNLKTSISIQKDLIIIGNDFDHTKLLNLDTPSPDNIIMAQLSFAQSLARSSKLSVLEDELENYLDNVKTIPDSLALGKIPLKRREIIQKTGILLRFRQYFNLHPENFLDLPEFYWENIKLEECYLKANDALDIDLRLDIVNTKLNYATELQFTLRQVLSENTAHRLELIITCLIFIEAVFALCSYFDVIHKKKEI
ncbi:hypothetical protein PORY_001985 [Pneumocystis oryctolagi]|uniref:Uncharacterized protein n=1 Tax=Pneumocystis oryctolagi TaxID=42067 RepID=A0ACB7CA41_9ASCO|nr:hypothetical protein PORY_001985 [Pneumocystis oryctolagi]